MDSNEPQILTSRRSPIGSSAFSGPFGLRAGWGIVLFIAIFLVLSSLIGIATLAATGRLRQTIAQNQAAIAGQKAPAASVPRTSGFRAGSTAVNEGVDLVSVALTAWILSLIERRRISVYGIGRSRLGDFLPGAFWGLATLSVLVGILRAAQVLVFDARALSGSAIFIYGAEWLGVFLLVGMLEEYLTRGYLQYTLTRGLFGLAESLSPNHARAVAFWIAAVIMSTLFGARHIFNPGETTPGIVAVFIAGLVFSYTLWHTGSLWWAIGFHMAWDWAQSFLYGVPDSGGISAGRLFDTHPSGNPLLSGGTTGPEGSILVIPTFLLVVLIVRFTTRPGIRPSFELPNSTHDLPPESHEAIA